MVLGRVVYKGVLEGLGIRSASGERGFLFLVTLSSDGVEEMVEIHYIGIIPSSLRTTHDGTRWPKRK